MNEIKNLDMPPGEFKKVGYKLIDWSADYLENIENIPVLPNVKPGEIRSKLPKDAPDEPESFDQIITDISQIILPGITHWQHPKFMAYFASTASGPGILADIISSVLNVNGMVWKSSPALTELEQTVLDWYRKFLGLPADFMGMIYDTASISSFHGLACAREYLNLGIREKGMSGIPKLRIYCSEHAHSSIDKGALALGLGLDGIKKIKCDSNFSLVFDDLKKAIEEDRLNGIVPMCVVATIGTTSSTAVDPVDQIADYCNKENIWLHVDAAYAGVTASLSETEKFFKGWEKADSIVSNPHKWLFVPIDLSTLYVKKPEILKRAFSLIPEYLKSSEDSLVENYMDYGIQLGRRFRALKLWFVIRYFGVTGLKTRIALHISIAKQLAEWIEHSDEFELLAPVNFSTVCFRAVPNGKSVTDLNDFNEKLLSKINSTGEFFLTHTKLNGIFTIRLVISGIRQELKHVEQAWQLIQKSLKDIIE